MPGVAGLVAADQTCDAVRKKHALLGEGIGTGAETAAAVANVAAQIKSAPVIDHFWDGGLDRHLRRRGLRGEREQGRGGQQQPLGKTTAIHGGGGSCAGKDY